jgi:oligopeptide transport system substrate-binding protein
MKKHLIFLTFAFFTFITSCSNQSEKSGNIFYINQPLGVETLEPVMSNSNQTIWALSQVMEGLVEYNHESEIVPAIAKKWEISEDGTVYTFTLRDDVLFHDDECFPGGKGRKVTASDFKYCLERVNDPKSKTRGSWVYRDKIKGVQEYMDSRSGKSAGASELNEISGIKALNDSTLQIELNQPFAPFLSILTMTYGFVYPREALDHYGERFGQHPVGTGPFKFSRWDFDKELVFDKNPSYWGKDDAGNQLPYLDGMQMTFTQSSETEYLDFVNGRYDFHLPSSETIDQLIDENGDLTDPQSRDFDMVRQPWLQTVFFGMMQDAKLPGGVNGPFVGNKKLRQALNYAVDREKIIKYVLKNRGTPASNGPLPVGMPGYNPDIKGYTYDKDKAMKLLEEAGYPGGKGLELTLYMGNDEIQKTIAIAVQDQLKELGIDLKLEQMLQATLISQQEDGKFPFWRASWGADYYDPENFVALFYSKNITPNGPNRVGYNNPEVDRLYEEGLRETDFNKRKLIYDELQKIVIEDAAWLYLYYNQQIYLLKKNIEGFYLSGLNLINLKYTKKN